MSLTQLPGEILISIFSLLGPEFFHQDVGRLTISRRWCDFAWSVYAEHLELPTAKSLMAFTADKGLLLRVQPYLTSLSLSLDNINLGRQLPVTDGDRGRWMTEVQSSLALLTVGLRQCSRLHNLKLQLQVVGGYLLLDSLADLVEIPHLTSLYLDAAGSGRLYPPGAKEADHVCFCHRLNSLLRTLRQLYCRMDFACQWLLMQFPPATGGPPFLDVQEVIVNISLPMVPGTAREFEKFLYSRRCHLTGLVSGGYRGLIPLKQVLHCEAAALGYYMKNRQMVRLISHELTDVGVFAYDCLNGEQLRLKSGSEWDAEGTVVDWDEVWPGPVDNEVVTMYDMRDI